jgi:hypothetical protein
MHRDIRLWIGGIVRRVVCFAPPFSLFIFMLTTAIDTTRRSSAGSIAPTTSPLPTSHRTDLFHSLRPMASTESMNMALQSKRTLRFFFSWFGLPCGGFMQEPDRLLSGLGKVHA